MKNRCIIFWLVFMALAACSPYPRESKRMAEAFEQAQLVYGKGENDTLLFIPELDKASAYYAQKGDYGKAALAALYHGYAEKDYDKTLAMNAFKEAEQYGELVHDSLTVARAQYQMGRMLYGDYMHEESLSMFKKSDMNFGNHYGERALVMNAQACSYILLHDYDNADSCLSKSLFFAEQGDSNEAKQKALNNYAKLYQLQGEYGKAIECLRMIKPEDEQQTVLKQLNLGNVFMVTGEMDSAAFYYQLMEASLTKPEMDAETKVAAYNSFSVFEELKGDLDSSINYRKAYEKALDEVWDKREQKRIYRIQRQYDYETLQNALNRKFANKQRIIAITSIMLALMSAALTISQIRLAQKRKQEAETNAAMFHFMRQNENLTQINEEMKQVHLEDEESFRTLVQKYLKIQNDSINYAKDLSVALERERKIMMYLHFYLQNPKDKRPLNVMETIVFEDKNHLDALVDVIDKIYPNQMETQKTMFPELEKDEHIILLLSHFNMSRQEEAALLDISLPMLDKLKGRMREKTGQKRKRNRK